jgi:hypothetical protein
MFRDMVFLKIDFMSKEKTLLNGAVRVCQTKGFQDNLCILFMFGYRVRPDYNVVQINVTYSSNKVLKSRSNAVLVNSRGVS